MKTSLLLSKYSTNNCSEYYISFEAEINEYNIDLIRLFFTEYDNKIYSENLSKETEVWIKLYVEDLQNFYNEIYSIKARRKETFFFIIEQAPANNGKIILESYHIISNGQKLQKKIKGRNNIYTGNNYSLMLGTNSHVNTNVYNQAKQSFEELFDFISNSNLDVHSSIVRTWLYIRDIDLNYSDVVEARKKVFLQNDLNSKTHFIASTGIEGNSIEVEKILNLYYLLYLGITADQIEYIRGNKYIGSTIKYGVTFERAIKVLFGDRSHIYISGTASIDYDGRVLFEKDVIGQISIIYRNISELLRIAKADISSLKSITVYLRNSSDYSLAKNELKRIFGFKLPMVITRGRVCRSGWLVEIEAIAITYENNQFPDFC